MPRLKIGLTILDKLELLLSFTEHTTTCHRNTMFSVAAMDFCVTKCLEHYSAQCIILHSALL